MKRIRFTFAFITSMIAIWSYAQNPDASFSCDDFEITAGETKIVKVNMTSKEENIYGFQVRITIPEELSFAPVSGTGTRAKYALLNSDRGSSEDGFSITTTKNMADIKSAVFLSTSTEGYPYYETSGLMFTFAVTASADIAAGSHTIQFSEIEITKDVNVSMNPTDFDISAKVLPTGVILNKETTSIVEGSTETLTAKLLPGEVVAGAEVSWSTSNDKVATVSNGVVSAVAMGEADITVTTSNGKTTTCKVIVTENFDKTAANFKTHYSDILSKTTSTVTSSDLTAIEDALSAYESLSSGAQAKLSSEKTLLDSLKKKAEELKAVDDAVAKFKTDNATILGKTTSNVTASDLNAINKALEDYNKLSDAAKAKLSSEKSLLDNLKKKAEELKAVDDAVAKFKTDNATILVKTTSTVKSSDLDAINKALEDYNKLSDAAKAKLSAEKTLLDNLKKKAEELKVVDDAVAKFKTDNATILGKTTSTVKSSDLDAINKALEDYNKLSDAAKAKLTAEKTLLDSLKKKAEELKAAEETDQKATDEANKFKTDNATILGKTTSTVKSSDLDAINKALEDYNKLSDAAKAKLTAEKTLLDSLKKKAEELKAVDDAVAKFKTDHATVLGKTTSTVKSSDLDAINKALEDYDKLSDEAKAKLSAEKTLLDNLKKKAEELKAAEEADKKATDEANKFKSDNATILGKTTDNVTSSDLDAINKALEDYDKLSDAAKAKLSAEKALLDALKAAANADQTTKDAVEKFKKDNSVILSKSSDSVTEADLDAINKALEDYNKLSDAAKVALSVEKKLLDDMKAKIAKDKEIAAEVEQFKTDNATILGKTTDNVTSSDLDAINKALEGYENLSDEAKAKLSAEKTLLDNLKKKAEELKAAEVADQKATDEANKFKTDNATILGKTTDNVTSSDLDAINKALEDYDKLSDAAKAKLSAEKALLDALKKKAEELVNSIYSISADKAVGNYYDMNGQRVNSNAKGLIIRNGKKVMVK